MDSKHGIAAGAATLDVEQFVQNEGIDEEEHEVTGPVIRQYIVVDRSLGMSAGKTELTPDDSGSRWTCVGFAPMDVETIAPVTGQLPLYH